MQTLKTTTFIHRREMMEHIIKFGSGEVLRLSEAHDSWLLMELSDEDVSFTEVLVSCLDQVQEIIDALEEHKTRMSQ